MRIHTARGYEIGGLKKAFGLLTHMDNKRALVLCFVLGFFVRLTPEVLSYPYPIGFDTVYYAARIKSGVVWDPWSSIFSSWLLYALLISIYGIVHIDPFLLLKLTAPILYAFNVCGVYYFSRKALGWDERKALTASFFCIFQLALLRLSWDLYRNMLGLAILLFTLSQMRNIETKKGFALFVLLSMLVVFAHPLVSVVLFAAIFGVVVSDLMKGDKVRVVKFLLAALPALVIFAVSVSLLPVQSDTPANVINTYEEPTRPVGLFLVNYLGVSGPVHNYPTYPYLVLYVLSLFSVLYLWWLPLVLIGFFRDKTLDSWTLVLLAGSFNALITPFCAINFWNRWMFMLVYPFTFYAVSGIEKAFKSKGKSVASSFRWLKWMRISRKTTLVMLYLTVIFGLIFMTVPPFFDRFGVFFIPPTNPYIPSTMLYNTVPLRDVESTIKAMAWLNEHMNNDSSVLVHHAFLWWASLYLDQRHMIVYYTKDVKKALDVARQHGFERIYIIWWNEGYLTWFNESIDWYGLEIPKSFIPVSNNDRISVFEYATDEYG